MKKVLFSATVDSHIIHFHLPYLEYFKKIGYEVHVATNTDEDIPFCDKKHKVSFERSPFKLNNLRAIPQLKKIITKEKFDLIHCHTPMGSVVTRLAARKMRRNGTRVIYTAHGFHFYKGAPLLNWVLFYPIEKFLSKYTDDLITINKEDYNLAKSKFNTTVHYIPGVGINSNKFDLEMTESDKLELRKQLGLNKDDFVMVYPAELNKNKNQKFLIEAMLELVKQNNKIHLILPGKDSYNGYYQKMVKEYDLDSNIHFLGYRTDIPQLLKISNVAVSSSLREGLPVNVMEAMYCKLPVVALECRGIKDLIVDKKNGFILSDDSKIKEFVEIILKIYNNKNIVSKIVKNNTKDSKKYIIDNILKEYIKVYDQKKIIYLRSTSIINDSRATKEINTYLTNNNKVIVLGWNRKQLDITNSDKNVIYDLYNRKSEYGNGLKNIFCLSFFQIWLYRKLKKYKNKYNIIHACDFDTAFIASKIAKKYNKKFIYDIYDYYIDCHNLSFLKRFIEKMDIKTINKADSIIICTEQRKNQILKCNPKNICVVHNSPQISEKSNKRKFNQKKIKVCYVGILQDDRLLIEISKEIIKEKNIEFHVGGFGKYEDYFKKMSEENRNINFYGQMKYEDVLSLESNCDILFATYNPKVPNHKYSAPNKVYEAMALGKPIIVCKDTGVDEMVEKEEIGFSIDYNASEFINTIKQIDSKKYDLIKEKSVQLYKNKYSWETMEKELLKNI